MSVLTKMMEHDYERVCFCNDNETQLQAIIAVHDSTLGPALGGTRAIVYDDDSAALFDVLRLSRGMTCKAALAGVPHGGGKAVIMMPKEVRDREALFASFGKAVNDLGGLYITTEDSGTSPADMRVVRKETDNVVGFPVEDGGSGDPSPMTARGTWRGIQAAAKHVWDRDDLEGLTVSIQGVGHVGYLLAKHLHASGIKLVVTDVDHEAIERCVDEFGATAVRPDDIYKAECDIFAPCALGAILNPDTIPVLTCEIVAGASNNQLLTPMDGQRLRDRGILYVPDYAINAGGLINVAQEWAGYNAELAETRTDDIYNTISEILRRADCEDRRPEEITDTLVAERIRAGRG